MDPAQVETRGRSGLEYLAARQRSDGSYAYNAASAQTPVWVTAQALLAVSREALPVEPVAAGRGRDAGAGARCRAGGGAAGVDGAGGRDGGGSQGGSLRSG